MLWSSRSRAEPKFLGIVTVLPEAPAPHLEFGWGGGVSRSKAIVCFTSFQLLFLQWGESLSGEWKVIKKKDQGKIVEQRVLSP